MHVLLSVSDAHVRDAARVALEEFDDLAVTTADADDARHLLRRRRFDLLAVFLRSESKEVERLVSEARERLPHLDVLAFAPRAALGVRRADKNRLGIYALLPAPVDPVCVYETIARWLSRRRAPRGGAPAGIPPLR